MRKLIQKGIHAFAQRRPITRQTMQLQDCFAQPPPQLLDRVEPRRIGRQPNRLNPWHLGQCCQHISMPVDRPVVLYHVDAPGVRIGGQQLAVELDDFCPSQNVGVQIVDLPAQGIERANQSPLFVVRTIPLCLWRHLWSCSAPVSTRRGPAIVAHLIQKHDYHLVGMGGSFGQAPLQTCKLACVLWIGTVLLDARRAQVQTIAVQQPPHATQAVAAQPGEAGANGPQGPASRCRRLLGQRNLLLRFWSWTLTQPLSEFGLPVKDASVVGHPADQLSTQPVHQFDSGSARHRRYRGHAVSASHGAPPSVASVHRRFSGLPRSVRRGRGASRGHVPASIRGAATWLRSRFVVGA
jgi:hypothetical protein